MNAFRHRITKSHVELLLALALFLGSKILTAQPVIPYKAFLQQLDDSRTAIIQDSLLSFLSTHDFHKPFVSRIELRTQSDEFRLDQQEYTLRIRTSDPFNNKYQNSINFWDREKINLKVKEKQVELFYTKHHIIAQYESLKQHLQIRQSKHQLLSKLLLIYKDYLLHHGNTDLERYFETDIKIKNLELKISETNYRINQFEKILFKGNPIVPNLAILPSLEQIQNFVTAMGGTRAAIGSEIFECELNTSKLKLDQEISNANRILDHIQIQYQSDPDELLNKKLSIGVGLRISQILSKSYLYEKYERDLLTLKLEQAENENKLNTKLQSIVHRIANLRNNGKMLQDQLIYLQKTYNIDSLANRGDQDLSLSLKIKLQENDYLEQIEDAREEGLYLFLDYLYYQGYFYQHPDEYCLTLPFLKL